MFSNLLAEMARKQLTREDVAKRLSISVPTFRKKLTNKKSFKLDEIKKLLNLFENKVSFDYLFFDDEEA